MPLLIAADRPDPVVRREVVTGDRPVGVDALLRCSTIY
jgi:hypothetical protein